MTLTVLGYLILNTAYFNDFISLFSLQFQFRLRRNVQHSRPLPNALTFVKNTPLRVVFFSSPLGVWICYEAQSVVFDLFRIAFGRFPFLFEFTDFKDKFVSDQYRVVINVLCKSLALTRELWSNIEHFSGRLLGQPVAHYQGLATRITSQCKGIFTDQSIFRYFSRGISQYQSI